MLRLRSRSTGVLFGAAVIAVSVLASPSFANDFDESAPATYDYLVPGSAQARFPAPTPSEVDRSSECIGGYRWIQRDPDPDNGSRREYSLPLACN